MNQTEWDDRHWAALWIGFTLGVIVGAWFGLVLGMLIT